MIDTEVHSAFRAFITEHTAPSTQDQADLVADGLWGISPPLQNVPFSTGAPSKLPPIAGLDVYVGLVDSQTPELLERGMLLLGEDGSDLGTISRTPDWQINYLDPGTGEETPLDQAEVAKFLGMLGMAEHDEPGRMTASSLGGVAISGT